MRVVHTLFGPDGAEGPAAYVRDVSVATLERGDEPIVVANVEGEVVDELARRDVPVRELPGPGRRPHGDRGSGERSRGDEDWWRAFGAMRSTLAGLEPDLVSTHTPDVGSLGRLAAASLRIPVVHTVHRWSFGQGEIGWRRAMAALGESAAAPLVRRILTFCDHDRRLALRWRVARSTKVVTVHRGVADVPGSLRADPGSAGDGLAGDPCRIVMTAPFTRATDHGTLLRALTGLKRSHWLLGLIGDGPNLEVERARARELGIEDRVRFARDRDDVPAILAEAHLFVLTSRWGGFPTSVLEAMRAGLPVVAVDAAGVGEAVVEGETGFVVAPDQPGPLGGRLAAMIGDPERRSRMGRAGRRRYEDRFTFDRMVDRTRAVYETTVAS